jgi:hypothetical protein
MWRDPALGKQGAPHSTQYQRSGPVRSGEERPEKRGLSGDDGPPGAKQPGMKGADVVAPSPHRSFRREGSGYHVWPSP